MKCYGPRRSLSTSFSLHLLYTAILFLALLCSTARAQVQNTLYEMLATSSTVTGAITLGPVRNIGQSFHQVLVTLQGGGCVPANSDLTIKIAGSSIPTYGSTAVNFSLATNNLSNNPSSTYQGVGAYPFVFVIVNVATLASCNYSVLYSGSVQPIQPVNNTINILNAGGAGSSTIPTGVSTLVAGTAGAQGTTFFYQMTFASDLATRVTLTCSSLATIFVVNIPTSGSVVVPYTGISHFACPAVSNVTATVAAATTVFLDFAALTQRGN